MSSRYTDEPKGPRRRLRRLVVRVKTPTPSRRLVLLRLSRHWPGRKVRVGPDYISISILVNEGRTTLRRVRRRVRKALEVNGFKRLRPDPLGWLFPLLVPGARRRGRPQKKSVVDAPEASLADLMSSYTPKQRETVRHGLRMLAGMVVRAHLRRQTSRSGAVPERPAEGEDAD